MSTNSSKIAYFSMEIGLNSKIPTYAGGLGVLAGDTLKTAADLHLNMIGVTLLPKNGYFFQNIDNNKQIEQNANWVVQDFLTKGQETIVVTIKGEVVTVGYWLFTIKSVEGFDVPIYFLTTDLAENSEQARSITQGLYGSDVENRLAQEIVLGVGGKRLLDKIGHNDVIKYHMNEGHSALLALELLKDKGGIIEEVKKALVFTTHTPVPAGHDKFNLDLVEQYLEKELFQLLKKEYLEAGVLNLTELALDHSDYVNGVAKKHAEVSKTMFPNYAIHAITNGVHAQTWVCDHFAQLYDEMVPGWRQDPKKLRAIIKVDKEQILTAHNEAKKHIIDYANANNNAGLEYQYFTLGWARRFTEYKRPHFLLKNLTRLEEIAQKLGKIQIIFAGKAHPADEAGKDLLEEVIALSKETHDNLKITYLKNYDMYLAKFLTSGVDVWLNTPMPPLEASGTSGMKAALNGIPHLSVLDGWWNEGYVEDETGWAFATEDELYNLLEEKILPKFYESPEEWASIMKKTIMLNGTHFNTHRMLTEYQNSAYKI